MHGENLKYQFSLLIRSVVLKCYLQCVSCAVAFYSCTLSGIFSSEGLHQSSVLLLLSSLFDIYLFTS